MKLKVTKITKVFRRKAPTIINWSGNEFYKFCWCVLDMDFRNSDALESFAINK